MTNLLASDLHGTLCYGNEFAVRESSNRALQHFGRPERFTMKDVMTFYGRPWADYFRELCLGISENEVSALVAQAITYDDEVIPKYVKPMKGAHKLLETVKSRGDTVVIVSTCQKVVLEKHYFPVLGIADLVDYTIGITDVQEKTGKFCPGEEKARALMQFIDKKEFQKKVMIGDRDTDIKGGKMAGCKTFYFNPLGVQNTKADFSIDKLETILQYLYG